MKEFIFTFGTAHVHPETGKSLGTKFVSIQAEHPEEARVIMELYFGKKWSHQYESRRDAGIVKFELLELPRMEWPQIPGPRQCIHGQVLDKSRPRGDNHGTCECCGLPTDAVNEWPGGLCSTCGTRA